MARPRYPKKDEPLPPPLPPEARTVGQVVAEAIALYRANFAWALALGLPVAVADQVLSTGSIVARILLLAAASPAFSVAYAGACAVRQDQVPPLRTWLVAVVVGVVTFLPAAFFFGWFVIVAILWLGLAASASILLLAVTTHLTQDVAAIPFLWIVPLALYLLTFIICFDHERWYVRGVVPVLVHDGNTIESLRVSAHRSVAAPAHVGEDLAHGLLHRRILRRVVARQRRELRRKTRRTG